MFDEIGTSLVAEDHEATAISGADAALVARARELARQVGAGAFSLLFAVSAHDRSRLAPVFDGSHPGLSSLSRGLSSPSAARFTHALMTGVTPMWWSAWITDPLSTLGQLAWARRTDPPRNIGPEGFALPVSSECGRSGALVFEGAVPDLRELDLCGLHCRAMALFADVARQRPRAAGDLPAMSKRELQCLKLTANGLTSEAIAARLGLSVHTANQYLTNSTQKLNAVNRIHAVAKALRLGLIE